jgi:predicted dienelactone hydrolase
VPLGTVLPRFYAAPALGFTFAGSGLAAVHVPVQLWRADDDQILPAPDYADVVRGGLPIQPEFHHVPHAGHFDFLAPCDGTFQQVEVCASARDFDWTTFHRQFNAEVVRFFRKNLTLAAQP